MKVRVANFPQLRLLCSNLVPDIELEPAAALAIYERGWRFIDEASLTPGERQLIAQLVETVGSGVLHV